MGKLNVSYSGDETDASEQRGELPRFFLRGKLSFCLPFFENPPRPEPDRAGGGRPNERAGGRAAGGRAAGERTGGRAKSSY